MRFGLNNLDGVVLGLLLMALLSLVSLTVGILRRRLVKPRDEDKWRRCVCGYPLQGVEVPRCPECGRAIGFDKSFDELGVPERDVLRHIEAKRPNHRSDGSSSRSTDANGAGRTDASGGADVSTGGDSDERTRRS